MHSTAQFLALSDLKLAIDQQPLAVGPETLLVDVIKLMHQAEHSCGLKHSHSLLVSDDLTLSTLMIPGITQASCVVVVQELQVIGLFTERDVVKLVASGIDFKGVSISEVMTKEVVTLKQSDLQDMITALSLLRQYRHLRCLPIVNDLGELVGIMTPETICQVLESSCIDITKRKEVEEKLQQTYEQLQAVVDAVPGFVSWVSTDGFYLGVNRHLAESFSLSPEAFVGQELGFLKSSPDFVEFIQQFLASSETAASQVINAQVKGYTQNYLVAVQKYQQGQRAVAVGIDITQRKQAEEALEQTNEELENKVVASQEGFGLLMNGVKDYAIFMLDPEGRVVSWNAGAERIKGYRSQDILGQHFSCFFLQEEIERGIPEQKLQQAVAKGQVECEGWRVRQDGTCFWANVLITTLKDEVGQLRGFAKVTRDITEHKYTQIALQESEAKLRTIIENSTDAITLKDLAGRYLLINPAGARFLGLSVEQVLGKRDEELFSPETGKQIWEADQRIISTGIIQTYEEIGESHGVKRTYLSTKCPYFSPQGELQGVIGICRDITKFKQVEESLRRQLAAVQAATDGIAILNEKGEYIFMNDSHAKIFGYDSNEELLGKTWRELYNPDEIERLEGNIFPILRQKGQWQGEATAKKRDGTTFAEELSLTLIADGGLIYVCRDISERKQVEEILRLWERAITGSRNGIVITDVKLPNQPVIYVNPAFERITGYSAVEVVGRNCRFLQGSDTHQPDLEKLRVAIKEVKDCTVILRNYRKDGSLFWNELNVSPIFDSAGVLTHYLGIQMDITHRKLAEEELQHAKDRLQAVLDAVPGLISWISSDLRYLGVNEHLAKTFNQPSESFTGQEIGFLKSSEGFAEFIRQFFKFKAKQTFQEVTLNLNGKQRSYLIVAQKYNNDQAAVSVGIDITDRRKMEEELWATTSQMTTLIQNLQVGILLEDESRNIILVNQAFCSMFRISILPELLQGINCCHLAEADKYFFVENEQFIQRIDEIIQNRQIVTNEELLLFDGRTLERDYVPILVGKNYCGHLWMYRDITKRKQIEQEIRKALLKEQELGELKSRFVSMTSHEFRTPLSTILSSAELLEHYRHRWTEEKQLTHLQRVQNAVKHMTQMLDDILIIGKAEAGKLEFNPTQLDLIEYCHSLVEQNQLSTKNNHNITFISQYQTLSAFMDKKMLGHILNNLLSNSIKYSPSGSTVKFTLTTQDDQALFEIQDQGIGIPSADLPRLFESFHRATNVGNIQGTGLGLTIVKKFVDLHQGLITVASEVEMGTTFSVKLPLHIAVQAES